MLNRRKFVSALAGISGLFALVKRRGLADFATERGVYHFGTYCPLCSGLSDLVHKAGPWTPEQFGRVKNNIADAITEAKQHNEAARATTGYMRHILGNRETAAILEAKGLKVDFERVLAALADEQLDIHLDPFFKPLPTTIS